jgi:hypothetical protein
VIWADLSEVGVDYGLMSHMVFQGDSLGCATKEGQAMSKGYLLPIHSMCLCEALAF